MSENIVVYTKNGCGQCLFTKKYLEKLGLDYEERNIETHPEYIDEVQSLGFQTLPVIQLADHEAFNGFQPEKLDALVP